MGIGGHFWGLLKPYVRNEDFDFLRDKKVAVDLSYWIVQNQTAIKGNVRKPHLRLTFFRTINLFSKLGAYPVFVVDGIPSPLKARARAERFYRATGIDASGLKKPDDGVTIERNPVFAGMIRECVELLELLGIPVLKARCEAEALCAQLNGEGHVDACITSDSDAFLYGAKCVIKSLQPNSRDVFECYHMSDIEAGLGLKRKQLVAISLLVGNDHDLGGVPGIGVDTAIRFVQLFSEDDILNRLHEAGKGRVLSSQSSLEAVVDCHLKTLDEHSTMKIPHCSHCGHPGSKKDHLKVSCEYCNVSDKCTKKPAGFKCDCNTCDVERISKEQRKHENWQIKICQKIAAEPKFPNHEIIEMYLSDDHWSFSVENGKSSLIWGDPQTESLIDFLAYHQNWIPSFIRQRMVPMLSTIFLRKVAADPMANLLLFSQYEFHSIQRVKVRFGHHFYLVKWRRVGSCTSNAIQSTTAEDSEVRQCELLGANEPVDVLDEPDVPQVLVDEGCLFLLTEENVELVNAAYPEKVDRFFQEKEMKESKSKRKNLSTDGDCSRSPKSTGVQRSITEFYRSTKVSIQKKPGEEELVKGSVESCTVVPPKKSRKTPSGSPPNLSKSVRRKLLFH